MVFDSSWFAVSKNFSSEEESVVLRMLQAVAVPVLGNVCHVFMHGLNRIQVHVGFNILFNSFSSLKFGPVFRLQRSKEFNLRLSSDRSMA